MTPKQKKRFETLCKGMADLLKEMETEHPDIMFFIDDGTPFLIDCPDHNAQYANYILANGGYWPRSGGGGF